MWLAPGQDIDLSVSANRRNFIDGDGKWVYLGANGEIPTGTAPAMFFSGGGTPFRTNRGTGGTFSFGGGTITTATTNPGT